MRGQDAKMRRCKGVFRILETQKHEDAKMPRCDDARLAILPPSSTVLWQKTITNTVFFRHPSHNIKDAAMHCNVGASQY